MANDVCYKSARRTPGTGLDKAIKTPYCSHKSCVNNHNIYSLSNVHYSQILDFKMGYFCSEAQRHLLEMQVLDPWIEITHGPVENPV